MKVVATDRVEVVPVKTPVNRSNSLVITLVVVVIIVMIIAAIIIVSQQKKLKAIKALPQ